MTATVQLVLHCGAHFTEEDRLLKSLLRNKEVLSARGVAVPGPGRYRKLLRDTLDAMTAGPPAPEARSVLLDAILDQETAGRVILSNAHFFGPPRLAVRNGVLYPRASSFLHEIGRLFPGDEVALFLALRNPATFVPAVVHRAPSDELSDYLGAAPPSALRWSELIERLRTAHPQMTITLWCNEDAPLIWGDVIREMAALEAGATVTGSLDLLSAIMAPEGMARLRHYLDGHDGMSAPQERRVMAAFLDKFGLEEEMIEEVDLPGWTDALVEEMTARYDDDMERIAQMEGVHVIAP